MRSGATIRVTTRPIGFRGPAGSLATILGPACPAGAVDREAWCGAARSLFALPLWVVHVGPCLSIPTIVAAETCRRLTSIAFLVQGSPPAMHKCVLCGMSRKGHFSMEVAAMRMQPVWETGELVHLRVGGAGQAAGESRVRVLPMSYWLHVHGRTLGTGCR